MSKIKKINFGLVEGVEKSVEAWIGDRKYRIPFFSLLVVLFWAISHAPYINLFFDSYFIILFAVALSPFILKIDAKLFLVAALLLFILSFVIWSSDQDRAEMIGNYIFILLLTGVAKTYFSD